MTLMIDTADINYIALFNAYSGFYWLSMVTRTNTDRIVNNHIWTLTAKDNVAVAR